MNFSQIKNIIWDWNGTLLNDVEMCIDCMNQLLEPRNLPKLDINRYREVFTFPVQDYYEEIGIDFKKDPFDIIGHQFMDLYFKALPNGPLFTDAEKVLKHFHQMGKKQFILSAMEQQALERALKDFNISEYFAAAFGIDNHLAAGKTDRAEQMLQEFQIQLDKTLLVGDTLHDAEVADQIGVRAVLIAQGHQNKNRLSTSGHKVYENLECLLKDDC